MIVKIVLQILMLFASSQALIDPVPLIQGPVATLTKGTYNYAKGVLLPDLENIKFLLYNRHNTHTGDEFINLGVDGNVPTYWNPSGALKVIVHGLAVLPVEGLEGQFAMPIARTYGAINNSVNAVVVDWTMYSTRINYPEAAKNTRVVGKYIARFLMTLKSKNAIPSWDSVHIIGYSLGAHVSGMVGEKIHRLTGYKVGRITGLDPAGPEFDLPGGLPPKDLSEFLDKSDAKFVDIIHCNMGTPAHWTIALAMRLFGTNVQSGHADFYPNGGSRQFNSCGLKGEAMACSHKSCMIYYNMSLTRNLKACPCSSYQEFNEGKCNCEVEGGYGEYLGERCRPTASGRYYLNVEKHIYILELISGIINFVNPFAIHI